jgi:hypothetical protein
MWQIEHNRRFLCVDLVITDMLSKLTHDGATLNQGGGKSMMRSLGRHRDDDPLVQRFADALSALAETIVKDPIDEIRGHFTSDQVRDWIRKNAEEDATKCALLHDRKRKIVAAFLLSEDNECLYSGAKGKRLATAFSAKTMDEEMREAFHSNQLVIIPLGS